MVALTSLEEVLRQFDQMVYVDVRIVLDHFVINHQAINFVPEEVKAKWSLNSASTLSQVKFYQSAASVVLAPWQIERDCIGDVAQDGRPLVAVAFLDW